MRPVALAFALLLAAPAAAQQPALGQQPGLAQTPTFGQPQAQQQGFGQPPPLFVPPAWTQQPAAPAAARPAPAGAPAPAAAVASLPPPPGATAESRAAARALGEVIGIEAQVDEELARIHRDLLQRVIERTGKEVDAALPIVDRLLMPGFSDRRAELKALLLEPWARNFTAGELRLLRSFFASPLGQRTLLLRPEIARDSARTSEEWSRRVFRDTTERNSIELAAIGLRF